MKNKTVLSYSIDLLIFLLTIGSSTFDLRKVKVD